MVAYVVDKIHIGLPSFSFKKYSDGQVGLSGSYLFVYNTEISIIELGEEIIDTCFTGRNLPEVVVDELFI